MAVTVEKFLDALADLTDYNTLGISFLEVVNAVMAEIWLEDVEERRKRPEPYLTTIAGQAAYSFSLLGTNVRKVIGVWQPGLSSQSSTHDQRDIATRIYDADWIVDNEARTLTYDGDPGATANKWRVDYFTAAPTLGDGSQIPLIDDSWVWSMLLPGCLAWFERSKSGEAGKNRDEFLAQRARYYEALRKSAAVTTHTVALGVRPPRSTKPL